MSYQWVVCFNILKSTYDELSQLIQYCMQKSKENYLELNMPVCSHGRCLIYSASVGKVIRQEKKLGGIQPVKEKVKISIFYRLVNSVCKKM